MRGWAPLAERVIYFVAAGKTVNGMASSLGGSDPYFVEVPPQIGRVLINSVRAGSFEFILAVAAGKQPHCECAGPAGGENVPNAVAHHD